MTTTDDTASTTTDDSTDGLGATDDTSTTDTGTDASTTDAEEGSTTVDEESTGNPEAARYRRRLRETEGELERVRGVVGTINRRDAETLAGQTLADGADMWAAGVALVDLLGEDGMVDPEKVTAAAAEVLRLRPHWAPRAAPPGVTGGPRGTDTQTGPTWTDALRTR